MSNKIDGVENAIKHYLKIVFNPWAAESSTEDFNVISSFIHLHFIGYGSKL